MSKVERGISQSVCTVCGETARPGSGTVLSYGSGGRAHTKECLAIAQQVIVSHRNGNSAEVNA